MTDTYDQEHGATRSAVKLMPMEVPKASDVLANELRERILDGQLSEGMALPPERELVAQTRMSRATVREALETREAIEPFCARLAARDRTDADLARLDEANQALADKSASLARFLQANVDWHVGVATASHNELLAGLMTALSRAIYTSTENERFVDDKVRHETVRAHRSITEAIRAQDPDAAVRRMERHVYAYAKAVLEVEERTEISVPDTE
jgi:DNA-binding FadR family transcriptional regulator